MKRLPHVAILLATIALVAADNPEKKKRGDAEKIQGKWIVVESHYKGKKRLFTELANASYTFSGKKLIVPSQNLMGGSDVIAFELRPDKKPSELDLIPKGDGKKVLRYLYELSGDTLTICMPGRGKPRPDAIGTSADDDRLVWVFERVKGDKK